jgi:IS5 family transposase
LIFKQINNTVELEMRHKRTSQVSIFETFAAHDIGRQLAVMSQWLDEHAEVLEWVHEDLRSRRVNDTGRSGLSSQSALRCALPSSTAS